MTSDPKTPAPLTPEEERDERLVHSSCGCEVEKLFATLDATRAQLAKAEAEREGYRRAYAVTDKADVAKGWANAVRRAELAEAQLAAATERAERAEALLKEALWDVSQRQAEGDAAQRELATLRNAADNYRQSTADGYGHTQSATYYGKELDAILSSSSEPRKGGET